MARKPSWISKWLIWICCLAIVSVVALSVTWFIAWREQIPTGALVVPRDFPTVQDALEAVSPSQTIALQSNEGPFTGPIVVSKENVSIISTDKGTRLQNESDKPAITILASGVRIAKLTIENSNVGIHLENAHNCILEDIHIESTETGISVINSNRNALHDISLTGNTIGIKLDSSENNILKDIHLDAAGNFGVRLLRSWSNLIRNVSVHSASIGLSLEEDSQHNQVLSSSFSDCTDNAVQLVNSSNNVVGQSSIERSNTGIAVRFASDNTLKRNQLAAPLNVGIALYKVERMLIAQNTIVSAQSGIEISSSESNTLTDNTIESSSQCGIALNHSSTNLLLANHLDKNTVGLEMRNSHNNRVLRNSFTHNAHCGIATYQANHNLISDNTLLDNPLGVALVESPSATLVRNTVADSSRQGVSLLNESNNNVMLENKIINSNVGIMLSSSPRTLVARNTMTGNVTGLQLLWSNSGTRIDANLFSHNSIGIGFDAKLDQDTTILHYFQLALQCGAVGGNPLIFNNSFSSNENYDVCNHTNQRIPIGANQWIEQPGGTVNVDLKISARIDLPQELRKGPIAVAAKDTPVHLILGRILETYLEYNEFEVIDLVGIDSEMQEVLNRGDTHILWTDLSDTRLTINIDDTFDKLSPTPAETRLTVAISQPIAQQLDTPTISEWIHWRTGNQQPISLVVPSSLSSTKFSLFLSTYGISAVDTYYAQGIKEAETLLKLGTSEAAIVETITETVSLADFVLLEDDRDFFAKERFVPILNNHSSAKYPELKEMITGVTSSLTTNALRSMTRRVRLLNESPLSIAREFLANKGLINR